MQSLFDYLQNENTMLFAGGITVAILLTIVLIVVVFSTRTKIIANRYHDLKQIDKQKTQKIATLEADLDELKTEHIAVLGELELFEQTKIKLSTITQQLKESKSQIKTLSKDLFQTQEALTQSNSTIETLQKSNEQLKEKFESSKKRNISLLFNNNELVRKLDAMGRQRENNNQEHQKEQFKKQINTLSLEILKPLQVQIASYAQKNSLKEKESPNIKEEIVVLKRLYEVIAQDTLNLSRTIKENAQANIWSSIVLDYVIEASGLQSSEYRRDFSMPSSNNELVKIDAIVRLPNTHVLLIDTQTPMHFYQGYLEASNTEQKSFFLKNHLLAVKERYKTLLKQNEYKLNTPTKLEFVLMVMPIEGALNLLLTHDQTLYHEAFTDKILMVEPAILLLLMRKVHSFWLENQSDATTTPVSLLGEFEKLNSALAKLSTEFESMQ